MGQKADSHVRLTETLTISGFNSGGDKGFWLYDKTRGMNLAMRAPSETEAFVKALTYYQKRLSETEAKLNSLQEKVDAFVAQFLPED